MCIYICIYNVYVHTYIYISIYNIYIYTYINTCIYIYASTYLFPLFIGEFPFLQFLLSGSSTPLLSTPKRHIGGHLQATKHSFGFVHGPIISHLGARMDRENGWKMVEKWWKNGSTMLGNGGIYWKRHEPNELNLSLNPTFGSFRLNRLCHLALSRERSQALCLLFVLPGYLVCLATMETSPCLCSICAVVDGIWFLLIPPSWMGFLMMNNNEYTYIPNHGPLTMAHVLKYIYMAVCQNLVPLVNIKIAGKWMFIPLKMVLIGIDP